MPHASTAGRVLFVRPSPLVITTYSAASCSVNDDLFWLNALALRIFAKCRGADRYVIRPHPGAPDLWDVADTMRDGEVVLGGEALPGSQARELPERLSVGIIGSGGSIEDKCSIFAAWLPRARQVATNRMVSFFMVSVDLDDADRAALIALLKQAIAADPFPLSARIRLLRGILAKLLSTQPPARPAATVKGNVKR